MKKILVLVPMLLGLGACGSDQPPPTSEPESAAVVEDRPAAPAPSDAAGNKQGNAAQKRLETFAAQLAADGKGHFRFNRVRDAKEGGKERRVFVEMIGMTDVQAADVAAEILRELGYKLGRRWSDENGVRISFTDKDGAPVRVLVRSREAHGLLKHEDATSSVYLTRPVGE